VSEPKHGLSLPDGGECGDPRFLVELAERAESAGWNGIFLEDYVCYQGDPQMPTCDIWPVLAAMAVRTQHVTLGTCVTPLPRLRPWRVAREAAAIDQLSGGRLVLGVGLGDAGEAITADPSFTHFGEERDLRRRAQMTDEALAIIDGLWRAEAFAFRGRHYNVDEVTFLPPPVQTPRIPIWIGGGYPLPGPTQRALRWDGSFLYKAPENDPEERGMTPDDVRELRNMAGDKSYTIAVGGNRRRDDWESERRHIEAIGQAGADWWVEWIPPGDRDSMRASVDRGPLRA
jgi:alkanesulfonate monooxygenase SsuD/methylene tetrahydromethanopterin reductase-like flavin-dependent oxidoreductase (luciferase family)